MTPRSEPDRPFRYHPPMDGAVTSTKRTIWRHVLALALPNLAQQYLHLLVQLSDQKIAAEFPVPAAERAEMMRGHGAIGRKYAGQVTQVISGSVGLDDWEWAVTLFADDPLVFKKLVYEMRFDPASARYALFGPFFTGIRFAPGALGEVLSAGVPR